MAQMRPLRAGAERDSIKHGRHLSTHGDEPSAMYQTVTRNIEVTVTPQYLPERSSPESGEYFWAYTIEITNRGAETVQLRTRHWRITDAIGRKPGGARGRRGRQAAGAQARRIVRIHQRRSAADAVWLHDRHAMAWCRRAAKRSKSRSRPSRSTARIRSDAQLIVGIRPRLRRLEHIGRAAEFAGDRNLAVLDHVVAVVLREALAASPRRSRASTSTARCRSARRNTRTPRSWNSR